jgi:hypothetical protein
LVHDNRTMQTKERFRFVAIIGLVVALLTAGISLAGDSIDTPDEPDPTVCEPVDDVIDDGDVVEGDEGEGEEGEPADEGDLIEDDDPVEDGDEGVEDGDEGVEDGEDPVEDGEDPVEGDEDPVEGDTEDCDGVVEDDTEVEDDAEGAGAAQTEFTAESCTTAAGLLPGEEPLEKPAPGELHGLENATAHLLWNCLDHPNHGLVNALTKHAEKLDAWLERQELKDERKAEREAARAEREAARAEREAARAAAKAARDAAHAAAKAAREAAKAAH